ncbi:MAG: prepilin-type N-terminal cleavage/methylation domain-containing protein [Phycisphaera sp.]|nr:prepilin-type N-terminal cleavage/methylation domain-containing protein [Phycisphaera sp.]
MKSADMRRGGFTLIELLVVVAIITLLIAILLPSLTNARETARKTICLTNQHQISVAWYAYTQEFHGNMVGPGTGGASDWVRSGNTDDSLKKGALWPYVNDMGVYRCPSDRRDYRAGYNINDIIETDYEYNRSYSFNHFLGYPAKSWNIFPIDRITSIPTAAGTMLMVEEPDWRGYNMGSWVVRPRFSPAEISWVDPIATWHLGGTNFGFADGHAEYRRNEDTRTAEINQFFAVHPNSPDLEYVQSIFNTNNKWY